MPGRQRALSRGQRLPLVAAVGPRRVPARRPPTLALCPDRADADADAAPGMRSLRAGQVPRGPCRRRGGAAPRPRRAAGVPGRAGRRGHDDRRHGRLRHVLLHQVRPLPPGCTPPGCTPGSAARPSTAAQPGLAPGLAPGLPGCTARPAPRRAPGLAGAAPAPAPCPPAGPAHQSHARSCARRPPPTAWLPRAAPRLPAAGPRTTSAWTSTAWAWSPLSSGTHLRPRWSAWRCCVTCTRRASCPPLSRQRTSRWVGGWVGVVGGLAALGWAGVGCSADCSPVAAVGVPGHSRALPRCAPQAAASTHTPSLPPHTGVPPDPLAAVSQPGRPPDRERSPAQRRAAAHGERRARQLLPHKVLPCPHNRATCCAAIAAPGASGAQPPSPRQMPHHTTPHHTTPHHTTPHHTTPHHTTPHNPRKTRVTAHNNTSKFCTCGTLAFGMTDGRRHDIRADLV